MIMINRPALLIFEIARRTIFKKQFEKLSLEKRIKARMEKAKNKEREAWQTVNRTEEVILETKKKADELEKIFSDMKKDASLRNEEKQNKELSDFYETGIF